MNEELNSQTNSAAGLDVGVALVSEKEIYTTSLPLTIVQTALGAHTKRRFKGPHKIVSVKASASGQALEISVEVSDFPAPRASGSRSGTRSGSRSVARPTLSSNKPAATGSAKPEDKK